jgi:D-alanyl-D-alanine carboxypeptidase (penicillin-binding protein 5/6)
MEWGFNAFDSWPLFRAGERVATADVQMGTQASVGLMAPRAYFATVPKGEVAPVSLHVTYDGPLMAPIVKGTPVAQLEIRIGSEPATEVPLLATSDVPRGGALDRLRAGLSALWP